MGKLTCPSHRDGDPNYIGIGDSTLIKSRSSKPIRIPPNGYFTDYLAFYFGARSPMLYAIQKGYNGVTKRPPQSIIYILTTFKRVTENNSYYIFTDGHAYHSMSQFFNNETGLEEVDWEAVNLVHWQDTEDDPDRKRRKQAELLVFRELPLTALVAVAVYNESVKKEVLTTFAKHHFSCPVLVKPNWYY